MRSPIKNLKRQTNSISTIKDLVPKGTIVQTYPFYDGAIEFALSESDRCVVGTTLSPVLYEFWTYTIKDPKRVSLIANKMFSILNQNTFDLLKENWHSYKDPFVRSALFFLLNRCSSLGMITHGELDTKNYNPLSLNQLRTFEIDNFFCILQEGQYTSLEKTEINIFDGGKYYYDLLSTDPIIGLEESPFKHTRMLNNFSSTPSIFIYNYHPRLSKIRDYNKILLDHNGRITTEDHAKEIILHNV